jgi:hypothetical protein
MIEIATTTTMPPAMKPCCGPRVPALLHRVAGFVSWIVPGAVLALMPKCPVCLAAYIALGTGIGLSLPAAENLRLGALVLCGVVLGALVVRVVVRHCAARARPRLSGGYRNNPA